MPELVAVSHAHALRRRIVSGVALTIAVIIGTGCTGSPHVASGTLADAKTRILMLVNATGAAIGAPAKFSPAKSADELPCNKTFLGYTVGHLSAHRAEVPLQILVSGTRDGESLLSRVEHYWSSKGYAIDRRGLSDHRFPKIRTHVGADLLVATGYAGVQRINVYGVTPCVEP
jgi:hypothetical protein